MVFVLIFLSLVSVQRDFPSFFMHTDTDEDRNVGWKNPVVFLHYNGKPKLNSIHILHDLGRPTTDPETSVNNVTEQE